MDTYFDNSILYPQSPNALAAIASAVSDTVSCGSKPSVPILSPLALRAREWLYKLQAQKTAFFEVFQLVIIGGLPANRGVAGFVTALQWTEVVYEELRCKDAMLQHTYMYLRSGQEAGNQQRTGSRTGGRIRDGMRSFANAIRLPFRRRGDSSEKSENGKTQTKDEGVSISGRDPASADTRDTDGNKKADTKAAPRTRRGVCRRIRHALSRLCRHRRN